MLIEKKKATHATSLLNKKIFFFFLKLIALIIIWECSYYFILEPARIPDKLLTDVITSGVANCIKVISKVPTAYTWHDYALSSGAFIFKNNKVALFIADGCNGLSLIIIYVGFIILLPYPGKRKIIFSIIGIVTITIANIIRCILLYWVYVYHKSMFEINHHYIFTLVMYLLIFYLWFLFTKGGKINEVR